MRPNNLFLYGRWKSHFLHRGMWRLVNIIVVLAMMLPNFAGLAGDALAAQSQDSVDGNASAYEYRMMGSNAGQTQPNGNAGEIPSLAGAGTPTIAITPTETLIVTASVTPKPEVLPTGTPTAISTPTEISTTTLLAPTPVPTLAATLTVSETKSSTVTLTIDVQPDVVVSGGEASIRWEITGWENLSGVQDLQLVFTVPLGFEPRKDQTGIYDVISGTLRIGVTEGTGKTDWAVSGEFSGGGTILVELFAGEEYLAGAAYSLKEQMEFVIGKRGGEAVGLGGQVRVTIPDGALPEDAILEIKPITQTVSVPYTLSGNGFEINATGCDSKRALERFGQAIQIEWPYQEDELWGDESGLTLFYYDEAVGTWMPLPSEVDTKNNVLRAWTEHFTAFDVDIQDWQASRLPTLDAFQVSQFTGAATYNVGLWTPPGPGGLQPTISLSYNSQTVD